MIVFLLKLSLLSMAINSCKSCEKLSNGCRFEEAIGLRSERYEIFICDSLKKSFEISEGERATCKKTPTSLTEVYFKLSSTEILDQSLNFTSLSIFLRDLNGFYDCKINVTYIIVKFSRLKGFDLNSSFSIINPSNYTNYYYIKIYDSNFQFFLNNQLQESCEEFFKWNLSQPKTIFQIASISVRIDVTFYYLEFSKNQICPLYFKNVNLRSISFYYQTNTFYKRNYLKFTNINNSDISFLNTNIERLWTCNNEKIDIDSNSFLNKYVFHNVKNLGLWGEINSIEKDIFKSFKLLKVIHFDMMFFTKLSRKGTEWISSINFDLHVNLSNKSELDLYINQTKMIHLHIFSISNSDKDSIHVFLDEDFCLFKAFPFDQLIIVYIKYVKYNKKYTCTIQWLLKNIHFYAQYPEMVNEFHINYQFFEFLPSNKENNSNKFEKCDFNQMLENCNRSNFHIKDNEWTLNDTKEVSILIEFIFIILLPIVCFIGLGFNLMIIFTLSIDDNKKDLSKVQYLHLKLLSVSNIMILIINILSLLYECQPHQGIFCSEVRKSLFVQYFKIIIGEFFCTFFTMISNFCYVGFSICRLSLIGKKHSKLIKFISELWIVYYSVASIIISSAFSVVKIFRYQVNEFDPNQDYPIPFDRNFNNIYSPDFSTKARLINVFNAVTDLINYLVFIIIYIILDIVLVRKLKKTLSKKMNSDAAKNKEVIFRVTSLVVTFVIFSILLKLPSTLKSIFDSIHLNDKLITTYTDSRINYLYEFYCIYARFCLTFDKFASILFTISILSNIFFYFLFDINLRFGFYIAYSKIFDDKESHLEYVNSLEKYKNKKNKK